jgi:hypothetical protein
MAKNTKKSAVAAGATDAEIGAAFRAAFSLLAGGAAVVESDDVAEDADEDSDDDEVEELPALDQETVEALSIKDLRATAKKYLGDDAPKTKADILEALSEFYDADEDSEDEDESDEDETDEEEGYTREELEEMDLKQLRKIAKDSDFSASDIKGLDQDALVDLLLGEDDDDEDDDDDSDDDEDEDDDDEEVEELDEDALKAMSVTELKNLAKEIGVKVKVPASAKTDAKKKRVYVEAIMTSADDDE